MKKGKTFDGNMTIEDWKKVAERKQAKMKKGETVFIKELDRGQVNYEIAILKHEVETLKEDNFKFKNAIKLIYGFLSPTQRVKCEEEK